MANITMFEQRRVCPGCDCESGSTLIDIPYDDPDVLKFLCSYYCYVKPETLQSYVRGGSLTLIECSRCRLIYQQQIPNSEFMHELYENWILEGDELAPTSRPMPVEHYTYLASEVMHLLLEQRAVIGSERRLQVLDFGMGWSEWLKTARSFGADTYGAELSESKVAYARSIGIPVLRLEELPAAKFDLICAEQVFEHVPDPARLLEQLAAALAPTGYLKISVPPGDSIKSVLSGWNWPDAVARTTKLMPVQPLEHINCFSTRSVDALAHRYHLRRAPVSALRAVAFSTGWHTASSAIKNLLRPFYRFTLKRGTYAIFQRDSNG